MGLCGAVCYLLTLCLKVSLWIVVTYFAKYRSDPFRWCSDAPYIDCHSLESRFAESNQTALKLIAASYGQTGTTTIIDAMRELGYRSYHADDFSIMAKGVMFDKVDPTYWANVVSRCRMEAISLEPLVDLLPLALSVSPQAKVILTYRDFPSWLRSTSSSGQPKDIRTQVVLMAAAGSRHVVPWVEGFDYATGIFRRVRMEGNPMRQPLNFFSYTYRIMCNGYGWAINDAYNRGTYKAHGHEEAYIAQMDEVRRLVPKDRLLEFNMKKHSWKDLEKFLGLPVSGKTKLPQNRSKNSRTNDVFLDHHTLFAFSVMLTFCALHGLNYYLMSGLLGALLWLLLLPCRGCCSSSSTKPAPAPAPRRAPAAFDGDASAAAEEKFKQALESCPVVAILRGVLPSQAVGVGRALVEAGVTVLEVPLNSPEALESIRLLAKALPGNVVVGAGTVLKEEDVARVAGAGGTLVVSPNMDARVIAATRALGLVSLPGVATPTEALAALEAGAHGLKAFPGEQLPPKILKAWRAILPPKALLLAVGGVTAENMAEYASCGVGGFGVGTALFRPGDAPATVKARAETFVAAVPR